MVTYSILIAGSFSFGSIAITFVDPLIITTLRFIFASILMGMILIFINKKMISFPKKFWRFLILGNLMGAYFVLMFIALEFTDPLSTGAVFTLTPFIAMYFGLLILNQKPSYFQIISLFIAGIGAIWVIFKGSIDDLMSFNIGLGELLFLVGCACQALYIPLVQKFNEGENILDTTFWTLIGATICFCIYSFFVVDIKTIIYLPNIVWFCLLYLTLFATAFSFFLLQYASNYLPPGKTISYAYLTPAVICFFEGLLGHGWVTFSVLFGVILIVFGQIFLVSTND
tara:strand:- start:114 stop:965 length:852 start_codon:yes stop_codon:yes gene_type:complete